MSDTGRSIENGTVGVFPNASVTISRISDMDRIELSARNYPAGAVVDTDYAHKQYAKGVSIIKVCVRGFEIVIEIPPDTEKGAVLP